MSRILVPFRGEGAGIGEMTWAQLGIWKTMVATGQSMNIGGTVPVAPGTTVEDMVKLLRVLVGRHQALRTRLRHRPDGPPQLVVCDAGEVPLEIVDVTAHAEPDPETAAGALRRRYETDPFDYETEWPVRLGLVRLDGILTHMVLIYCHVAVDGFGIDAVVRDLPNLDNPSAPVSGLTPLEMTAKQHTPAGKRQGEKSLRYWEQHLRAIPALRFGTSDDPREPRYWELTRRSPAMHLAMQAIAHRTGAGVGYILLAAYAVGLARRTGINPSMAQLVVSNRFRPGCGDSVSQLAQLSICVIDVADTTFDEVVARAWNAATNAYMHGYYDPLALDDLLTRVRAERGDFEISIIVNDRRTQMGPPPLEAAPTPADLESALPRATTWWNRKVHVLDAALNISVDAAPGAVDLTICADTHRLGPDAIEALSLEMERVLIDAAFDPAAPTGVRGLPAELHA